MFKFFSFYRKVSIEEASKAAEHIGLCHFVETSAAESFEAVDSVFRQLFRLVKASSQALDNATLMFESNGPKGRRRRRSLTQMKQKILEHCRKIPPSADIKPQVNMNKDISLNFNRIQTDIKEKHLKNKKYRRNSSKSSIFAEKCRSLGTLREQPEEDQIQSRSKNSLRVKTLPNNIYDKDDETSNCSDKKLWIKRKRSKTSTSLTSEESLLESSLDETNSLEGRLSPTLDEVFRNSFASLNKFPVTPELMRNDSNCVKLDYFNDNLRCTDQNRSDVSSISKSLPIQSNCKFSVNSNCDIESLTENTSVCCSKKNQFNKNINCTANGILRIFKNAVHHEKVEEFKEQVKKNTFYTYNEMEEKNNKNCYTCENFYDVKKPSSKPKQIKQKHRKKPSLRDAVNEIIRIRKKSAHSINLKNVGVI